MSDYTLRFPRWMISGSVNFFETYSDIENDEVMDTWYGRIGATKARKLLLYWYTASVDWDDHKEEVYQVYVDKGYPSEFSSSLGL